MVPLQTIALLFPLVAGLMIADWVASYYLRFRRLW